MKKYRVNVNGTNYEIAIELLGEEESLPAAATDKTPKTSVSNDASQITSPMPGTILSINAAQGSRVKKGDVLMILEAMKMENEILAPKDGTLLSLNVNKGSSVESGTLLCTLA